MTMQPTRRQLVSTLGAAIALPAIPALPACGNAAPYEAAVASTWRHADKTVTAGAATLHELVRYATLAANGHNTQPWRFALESDAVTIRPDASRRTPAVDPDDHHLWVSLGCATENLLQAALANGLLGDVSVADEAVHIALRPVPVQRSAMFDAIVRRQCTRSRYDGSALSAQDIETLNSVSSSPTVSVQWLLDKTRLEGVVDFVSRGVKAQMADAAFVAELKNWIRFSHHDAVATRDGLFSASSANPVLPHWLGSRAFNLVFTSDSEIERYTKQLRSSAGVAVFVAAKADIAHWVDVGRAYQRFALQATAMNVRNAFLNQPVEVPAVRHEFASWLGVGAARPDLVVRFGRAAPLPQSLRRPVESVLA